MKKETLITAVVFLGAGFLAGYVYNAQQSSALKSKLAAPSPSIAPAQTAADTAGSEDSGDAASGLPKGHPPVNDAEIIQFFESASARNPNNPEPRLKLANFLYDRRRFTQAIAWYQQALQLDPRDVDARTDLATCYFHLGDVPEALDELHQALKIDPHHEPSLFNLIIVNLEGAHDLPAAQKAWARLHEINPGYPRLHSLKQSLDAAVAAARKPPSIQ